MSLLDAEIQFLAQRAQWNIDCELKPNLGRYSSFHGDSVVIAGEGVRDLDRAIALMEAYPNGRFTIDVGRTESAYRPVSVAEMQALRSAYVSFHGAVNKPGLVEDTYASSSLPV